MSEPINTPNNDAAELVTLRALREELLQAKATLKARVTTLETEAVALTEKANKAEATMHTAIIELPLKNLAEQISPAPELFLSELQKDYSIEANERGELILLTKQDSKPVMKNGKPIEFTHTGLYQALTDDSTGERSKVFSTIMRYSGASGGLGRQRAIQRATAGARDEENKSSSTSFGLR